MCTLNSLVNLAGFFAGQHEETQHSTVPSSPTASSTSSPGPSIWDVIDLTSDDETILSPSSTPSSSAKKSATPTTVTPTATTEDVVRCHIQRLPDVILKMIGEYVYAGTTIHHYKGRAGKVKKNQLFQTNSALLSTCKGFKNFFMPIMTSNITLRYDSTESMIDCMSSMTKNAVKNVKRVHVVEQPFTLTFEDQVMKKVGKKQVMKPVHTTCLYTVSDIFTLFPHLQCDVLVYEGYLPGLEEHSPHNTSSSISALVASRGWKSLYCIQTTFYRESDYLPFGEWPTQLYYACKSKRRMANIAHIFPPDTRAAAIMYTPFWTSFASSACKETSGVRPTKDKNMHGAVSLVVPRNWESEELSTAENCQGLNLEKNVRFKKAMDENANNWLHIKKKSRFHSLK